MGAGLSGDPDFFDKEMQQAQDPTRMALALRTRLRLQKYGVLQLRMLDLYVLKRVRVNPVHIKMNKKLQVGHADTYEKLLIADGKHAEAEAFANSVR